MPDSQVNSDRAKRRVVVETPGETKVQERIKRRDLKKLRGLVGYLTGRLDDHDAEIARLREKNERLTEWVTHWRECNARNVKDIDHHRAGIRWAQGMCSDGETVEAISAHLTKVLSTMPGESPLPSDEEGRP